MYAGPPWVMDYTTGTCGRRFLFAILACAAVQGVLDECYTTVVESGVRNKRSKQGRQQALASYAGCDLCLSLPPGMSLCRYEHRECGAVPCHCTVAGDFRVVRLWQANAEHSIAR